MIAETLPEDRRSRLKCCARTDNPAATYKGGGMKLCNAPAWGTINGAPACHAHYHGAQNPNRNGPVLFVRSKP